MIERDASPRLLRVGILAVQGDFAAHAAAIERAGHIGRLVRRRDDFDAVDALVIPGGESTAMLHGIRRDGLDAALREILASGRPIFGTCAGAILLARSVTNPRQESFDALDIDIERNAYGTQTDSFDTVADVDESSSWCGSMRCVLIRAPRITRVGPGVQIHARIAGVPILVSHGSIWAATFHPELTDDTRVLDAVLRSRVAPSRRWAC